MPERWTTESPARTCRLRMSISISPSLIVGTIGRSNPNARRVITMDRASSSSGEKGTARMSSTPRSNALSFGPEVAASGEPQDRRHAPRQGVRGADPPEQGRAVVVVHVDHGQVRPPLVQERLRLGQAGCRADDEQAVVERQLDEVHDQRTVVEHQCATRFVWSCIHVIDYLLFAGCINSMD